MAKKSQLAKPHVAPAKKSSTASSPFVVGIGASAGGLEALRTLFSELNEPTDASFIIVQHMSPNYRSLLAELIGRESPLTVKEAEHLEKLKPNIVYVTPPNRDILLDKDVIKLEKPVTRIAPKPSVDRFFMSLGEEFEDHCGGIILSGTGSDGAQGIIAIKSAGGFTIAQAPGSAKYDGMPNSAIQTGAVDLILTPQEIAKQLRSVVQGAGRDDGLKLDSYPTLPFQAILEHVRRKKRVDFSQYKPNTLMRRIKRRMGALQTETMEDYFKYLKQDNGEVDTLYRDLTISVTAFFRDGEYFQSLTKELTKYLTERNSHETIRAWSAGCATGEEAYSMAILFNEITGKLGLKDVPIQIFATDINELGMEAARKAVYSPVSLDAVPSSILRKYFDGLDGKYRVKKFIREMVVFARHDLTADPPFLKMDLTCCRNVFIYFAPKIQEKIFKIFHYSLNPRGVMFLGKSESISGSKAYFEVVDPNAKIFRRADRAPSPEVYFSSLPANMNSQIKPVGIQNRGMGDKVSEFIQALLPNSIIVDSTFQVLEVIGGGRNFLEIRSGKVGKGIDDLIVESLRSKVLTLLHRSRRAGEITKGLNFNVVKSKKKKPVPYDIIVYPLKLNDQTRFVVSFIPVTNPSKEKKTVSSKEIHELERELSVTREHLQTVIEEQETANEELQALNEELQSTNEELQSTNEELETSNEELQSTNEELTTLNEEMNVKTNEVISLFGQLQAVQNATRSPILVVDRNMNLVRYNEAAGSLLSIDDSILEKSIYLANNASEVRAAFDVLNSCIRTRQSVRVDLMVQKRSFITTADPVLDDRKEIRGAVLSLVDNSDLNKNLNLLKTSEGKLKSVLENTLAPVSIRDTAGSYIYANKKFCEVFGLKSAAEVIGKTSDHFFEPEVALQIRKLDSTVLNTLEPVRSQTVYEIQGSTQHYIEKRFALVDAQGAAEAVCTMAFDITEQVEANHRLNLFKEIVSASNEGLLIFEENAPSNEYICTFVSKSTAKIFGRKLDELMGSSLRHFIDFLKLEGSDSEIYQKMVSGSGRVLEWKTGSDGDEKWYEMHSTSYRSQDEQKQLLQIFCVFVDITARKENERILREKQEEILRAGRLSALGEMAAGLAHEINTPLNVIVSQIDLLFADHDFPPQSKGALNQIINTVENISGIIKGLKSLARLDTDRPLEKIRLNHFVRETANAFALTLRHRGIRLIMDIPDGDHDLVCRPIQLGQVLLNLVNNAADAVHRLETKWIKIEMKTESGSYVIRVTDSGDGIPTQHLAKIMTPFYTTKKTGTGLGLSLSSAIIRQYGGSLSVDTKSSNTCFEVRLPTKSQLPPKEATYAEH